MSRKNRNPDRDTTSNLSQFTPKRKTSYVATILATGLFLTISGTASAASYTVCSSGCDFTQIQSAISDVGTLNGDTIYVLDGTYAEKINFSGKDITVASTSGSASTFLTGDGTDNPVVTFGSGESSSAVLDGFTIDNSYGNGGASRGIYVTGSSPTIKNSKITGNSISTYSQTVGGGGIYLLNNTSTTTLQNVDLSGNAAKYGGGALYADNADVTITGSVTIDNNSTSDGNGGAIYGKNGADISITGDGPTSSSISSNSARYSASGIYFDGNSTSGISLADIAVSSNTMVVGNYGGGMYLTNLGAASSLDNVYVTSNVNKLAGGGIYAINSSADLTITNSKIDSNTANGGSGGGIYAQSYTGTITISNSSVDSNTNTAGHGGGIFCSACSDMNISNTSIDGNTNSSSYSTNRGGGIAVAGASNVAVTGGSISKNSHNVRSGGGVYVTGTGTVFTADKVRIEGNRANESGGGFFINGGTTNITNSFITGNITGTGYWAAGGGIFNNGGTVNVDFTTIAGNWANREGGGIVHYGGTMNVDNSILWFNYATDVTQEDFWASAGTVNVDYSAILYGSGYSGTGNITAITGDVFVNHVAAASGNPKNSVDHSADYHILYDAVEVHNSASSATVTVDFDGDSRPHDGGKDMGADEDTVPPPPETISGTVYTDEGTTTIADGTTVRLVVNGTSVGTGTTTSGAYSITAVNFDSGDDILVYIDGAASVGNTVTESDGNALSGLDIYADHLIIRNENGANISNGQLSSALGAYSDTEVLFSITGTEITVSGTGTELYIPTGHTYVPGGVVNTISMDINGSFTHIFTAVNVSGNWDATGGTYNGVGTVTFKAISGTATINPGGTDSSHDFDDVVFNDNAGSATFTLAGAIDVNGDMTITDGIFNTDSYDVTVGGYLSQGAGSSISGGASVITVAGDVTLDGTDDSTGLNSATLVMTGAASNLTYNNLASYWANGVNYLEVGKGGVTDTLNSNMAVRGVMTVGSGEITGAKSFFMRGEGTPLSFDSASTVSVAALKFNGASQNLPTLTNGYDTHVYLIRNNMTLSQSGNVTINGTHSLYVTGNNNVANAVTYNTGGYDLTVGNKIEIGVTGDTAVKTLNGLNSIIDVGTAININSALAVFNYTSGNVTVAGNPYP